MKAKLTILASLLVLVNGFTIPSAYGKDNYWKPTCGEGWTLEQNKKKREFRCAKPGGMVKEFRMGRCKRPSKLRRIASPYATFGCVGTTIQSKGGPGISGSWREYDCPSNYDKERDAEDIKSTCSKKVPGNIYEPPKF